MRIAMGVTGASGAIYAQRFIDRLCQISCLQALHIVFSPAGERVWQEELGIPVPVDPPEGYTANGMFYRWVWHHADDIGALPASGSTPFDGYVVLPCSMGTLGRIAAGSSDNLIVRMADVALKERRPLVLVPRETPLSAIHLENMLKLTRSGARILPAMPGFYYNPQTIEDLVDFVLDRVEAHLGIETSRE